jgi:hypothetical protein
MNELCEHISALIAAPDQDLDEIEHTLTDGYAHALLLEAERWRLEKRIAEGAQGLQRGDTEQKVRDLTALARRLDRNADELAELRALLVSLRRHADDVRVGVSIRR